MRRCRWALMMGAVIALGACVPGGGAGDGNGAPADVDQGAPPVESFEGLARITVTMRPAYALVPGLPRPFFAEGHFDDGTSRDITGAVTWSASDPTVLTFDDAAQPGRATVHRAPDDDVVVTATFGGVTGELTIGIECEYPRATSTIYVGSTLLPLSWDDALLPDGSRGSFSLQDVYCGDAPGEPPTIYAMLLVTNWCPACHGYLRHLADIIEPLRAANGAIVVVSLENDDFEPATTEEAVQGLQRMVGSTPVYMVGDKDVGNVFARSGAVSGYPSMIVVRTRDMTVLADSESGAFRLDLAEVAANPDAGWETPPPVEIDNHCAPGQDEEYEPNNTPDAPAVIGPGSFQGGVCDEYPDFYLIDIAGPWRLTLEFSNALGNLDVYGWDAGENGPLRVDQRVVGSFGATDGEVLEHVGPTLVRVGGFLYESAPYMLSLEAL